MDIEMDMEKDLEKEFSGVAISSGDLGVLKSQIMRMGPKYSFTDETVDSDGRLLQRIKAERSFGGVEKGDLGGFLENSAILSHYGECWVDFNSEVFGNSLICGNAHIGGQSRVYDSTVSDNAIIRYDTTVGNSIISGNAIIEDGSFLKGCRVKDRAHIEDHSIVNGHIDICDDSHITGETCLYGNFSLCGKSDLSEGACINDSRGSVYTSIYIWGKSLIHSIKDVFTVSPIEPGQLPITFYRNSKDNINVCCSPFRGSVENFRKWIKKDSNHRIYYKQYELAIKLAKLHISR